MNKDGTRNEFWIVSDNQWSILGDPFEEIRLVEDGFVRNISDYGKSSIVILSNTGIS